MTDRLRIGIAGIGGRMGHETAVLAGANPTVELVGGLVRPGSIPGNSGSLRITDDPAALLPDLDCLIDLSRAEISPGLAIACAKYRVPMVCGVTGLDQSAINTLRQAGETIPLLWSRNLSVGLPLIARLVRTLAAELADYDIEIIETHHNGKRDAPSGTALLLAEAAAEGRSRSLDDIAVYGRSGVSPRTTGEIGIHAVRAGAVTGEHLILFAGTDEEIRISHRALNRQAFARGAIAAAHRLSGCEPGFRTVL